MKYLLNALKIIFNITAVLFLISLIVSGIHYLLEGASETISPRLLVNVTICFVLSALAAYLSGWQYRRAGY